MLKTKAKKISLLLLSFMLWAGAGETHAQNLTFQDILRLPVPPADRRIPYGSAAQQFGELRLPAGRGPHPVVIVIHGGCWFSAYDLNHIANFSAALTRAGFATWSLEYRRIGERGGGWPGTFEDVARGADHLRVLRRAYPLDLRRVVAIGHSAGGQLALWLAARQRLPEESPLRAAAPLPLRGVVSLAGITNLREFRPDCDNAVSRLLGGAPAEVAGRYQQTSPIELLPLRVPQRLIHGARDRIVPLAQSEDYVATAMSRGDQARLTVLEEAGHFELISPQTSAWPQILEAVNALAGINSPRRVTSRRAPRRRD